MARANSVIDVILGEAKAGSFEDMLAIASVIENRARQLGVTPEEVVSVNSEFNAYGKALPPGVTKHRQLANQALEQVRTQGPVHDATFYATPSASKKLPSGLNKVTSTDGHVYYSDPKNRSIRTSAGFKRPQASPMAFSAVGPTPPAAAPRGGQEAIEAALATPGLRSRAQRVADDNSAPLAMMPALDQAFDYPLGQKEVRVAGGYAFGPENFDVNKMDPQTAYAARRAFDNLGIDPTINSAFRSGVTPKGANVDYNRAVGGRPGSQHRHGKALDISTTGMSDTDKAQLVDALMAEGLGGIGVGRNIVHADSGRPRTWDYGNSVPSAVQDVINSRLEGNRLNRYPSQYGNIGTPQAKPEPFAGPSELKVAASGRALPNPAQSASTSAKIAPLPSFDQMAAFSAVRPTESPGLSLGTPIGPEVASYGPSGPSRRLGPRGVPDMAAPPSMPSPAPMSMTQLPALDPAVEIASRPTATIAPPQPAPMLGVPRAKPGMSPPPLGGSVLPREKPARPTPQKRFAPMATQLAGGLLGGFLGGPVGALGGAFVGRQLGRGGLPQMGPLSIGSIVNQGGFERTPVGGASRAATQGGGFDNRAFTKTYADLGGSSDPHSYSRALAEEQRQRSRAGQKTVMDAFGGLFR